MATDRKEQRQGENAVKAEESGDWLADIFDAVEDGAITSSDIFGCDVALPNEAIAELEALARAEQEGGSTMVEGDSSAAKSAKPGGKRGRSENGEELAKHKKSRREKLRREALNDR